MRRSSGILCASLFGMLVAIGGAGCSTNTETESVTWPAERSGDLLIRNVAVLDVATGSRALERDVLVRGGRIDAVEPAGTLAASDLEVIEGAGARRPRDDAAGLRVRGRDNRSRPRR